MLHPSSPSPIHPTSSSSEHWPPENRRRPSRFPRACTSRASKRPKYPDPPPVRRPTKAEREERQLCARLVTPLLHPPPLGQTARWAIRGMWEFAAVLDFLHVFWPLLNVTVEFSAEELETALITPNSTLDDIHIPILKAIPPIARMALGRATWVTVLCRKLRDWWHWVADGELPIIASHGTEIEKYRTLEPATRVLILKALCDIRVEQEDIKFYIDNSMKHGMPVSAFRKERIGGDSYGVSFWYGDDNIIGHRLYREIRKIESKKLKGKGMPCLPIISCQWETVATNFDEFQEVSDKLFSSKNNREVSLAKKLKIDILPEVEKVQKRKERSLKKQHRQALLLDSFLAADGLSSGRSLRDRKPVTYTFDDYDRSINEAIKITKKRQSSPEQQPVRKEPVAKTDVSTNGKINGALDVPHQISLDAQSPKFSEYEESDDEQRSEEDLDRSNRRRKRPQRYSEKDFIEAVSDNEADFDSDDDIVGEAIYDEEYLRDRKQRKISSSSEGDEEYSWEDDNAEDEEEDEAEDSMSFSEDSDEPRRRKKVRTRSKRGTRLRSVGDLQMGPRRSKRSTRPRINYRQYELSESDADSAKPDKSNASDGQSDASNDPEISMTSEGSHDEDDVELKDFHPDPSQDNPDIIVNIEKEENHKQSVEKADSPVIQRDTVQQRRFLDLNELAPGTGFDDGLGPSVKDDDTNNF